MDEGERQLREMARAEAVKPRKSAIILVIPILAVIAVMGSFIGSWVVMVQGREADGERVELTYEGCPEALEPMLARLETMGLDAEGVADGSRLQLKVQLPSDPEVAAQIPVSLAKPGVLTSHRASDPSVSVVANDDITHVAMRQDLTLIPWTVLTLDDDALERLTAAVRADKADKVIYVLDGEVIARVSNLKGANREVELTTLLELKLDDKRRMHVAAERWIVLSSGPLPCEVSWLP